MNMKTPSHLLQDAQPTCETSAEAIHKAPLGTVNDALISLPQPCLQSPQPQPLLNERTNSGSCGAHAHRSISGPHKFSGSHKLSENSGVSATVCTNCGTSTTPLWRRAPNGETICNACGLYLKARNTVRPPWLKRNPIKKAINQPVHDSTGGSCPGDGQCNGTGGAATCDGCPAYNQHQVNRQALVCANCRTITTPLWRRDEAGNTICNACGLYYKLHNVHRPITMKRTIIKRRKRVALPSSPQPHHHHHIAPSPSTEDGDLSDNAPGLSHESSGGETGSGTEEEDSSTPISRKRKAANEPARNLKRIDVTSRSVPAIEDYVPSEQVNDVAMNQQQQQAARDIEERRRSLTPVEPATFHSASPPHLSIIPQVQIHNHHHTVPVYHSGAPYQRPISPVASEPSSIPYSSHAISALLNPTTSSAAQLPSISLPHVSTITSVPQVPYQVQQTADVSATQQVLATHRQELQREVTNLSVLLTRTAAMLNKLDNAMAAAGQPTQPIPGADPLASIMALSNAAASAPYVTNSGSATSTMSLPPLSGHHTLHHFPPVMVPHTRPGSPPRAGSCSPKQLPTPPGSSPTILPLPINYPRA